MAKRPDAPRRKRTLAPAKPDQQPPRGFHSVKAPDNKTMAVYSGDVFLMTIPLDSKGAIPKRFAFDRLLATTEGTRRGRKRNPAVDQKRRAKVVYRRDSANAFLWVLFPNESDLAGVDTEPFTAPPPARIQTENDLGTIAGVQAEVKKLNAHIRRQQAAGRAFGHLIDAKLGLEEYRESLLEGKLGDKRYARLLDQRELLGDKELELAGREEAADAIERPSGTKGISNEVLLAIAAHEGRNPYDADWGDSLDPAILKEAREGRSFKQPGVPTVTELRQEVRNLRADIRSREGETTPEAPVPAAPTVQIGQGQTSMGIGEAVQQGSLLGEFKGDGGAVGLADREQLEARQRVANERARGQSNLFAPAAPTKKERLKNPKDKRQNLLDSGEIRRRQSKIDATNRGTIRRESIRAETRGETVPYSLASLVDAKVPEVRIRKVYRSKATS